MKISDFLVKNNVGNVLEKEAIVSDRFVDEEGNHIPFKIRNITAEEIDDINRLVGDNKSLTDIHVVANCCVEPNFKSVELQNHYGVTSGSDLVKKVLLVGEVKKLSVEVLKLSGYFKSFDDLIEDAKKQ